MRAAATPSIPFGVLVNLIFIKDSTRNHVRGMDSVRRFCEACHADSRQSDISKVAYRALVCVSNTPIVPNKLFWVSVLFH